MESFGLDVTPIIPNKLGMIIASYNANGMTRLFFLRADRGS